MPTQLKSMRMAGGMAWMSWGSMMVVVTSGEWVWSSEGRNTF